MRSLRNGLAVSLFAAALTLGRSSRASADELPPPPNDAPVWLAVSVDELFDLGGEVGSPTILVNIGTFVASDDPSGTTFDSAALESIPLPEEAFADLFGNQATVFGTVQTTGEGGEPHLYTPVPDEIPPEIQAAVHIASTFPYDLEDGIVGLAELPPITTTLDVALAIHQFVPFGEDEQPLYGVQDVLQHVFATNEVLRPTADGTTLSVTSEGEMFPHDPGAPVLIFSFTFDENGDFDSDLCVPIAIDVMPGSDRNPIHVAKKKGDLPIALLGDGDFDAADVDGGTVVLGGIKASRTALEDVDGDGDLDLVCHWDLPTLVEAGLTEDDDRFLVFAELQGGGCVAGRDDADTFSK